MVMKRNIVKSMMLLALVVVLAGACKDRDAEKKIAQLESRLDDITCDVAVYGFGSLEPCDFGEESDHVGARELLNLRDEFFASRLRVTSFARGLVEVT